MCMRYACEKYECGCCEYQFFFVPLHAFLSLEPKTMMKKRFYISPQTAVLTTSSHEPIMVEMTLYENSPFTTLTTIEYGPFGYTSSDGSW